MSNMKKQYSHVINDVLDGSIAQEMEIEKGDILLEINGNKIEDIFDYQYLVDLDTRMESVKQGEGLPNDWTPDQIVKEAMEFYSSFKPTSALLLEDTRVAVDKLREHLKNMDFNEVDDKGKPKYTLNTITSTIKQIPELIKGLDEAEKAVTSDIREMSKARGNHEKAIMEDF